MEKSNAIRFESRLSAPSSHEFVGAFMFIMNSLGIAKHQLDIGQAADVA